MSSRPQVGIERLPARRMSNEQRESMNCKSCRKRKIKCNRLRPTCEACQVFQCPCIYDAVPKKRGPKTDVLEALLKRVDGLEKRLKDEKKSTSPTNEGDSNPEKESHDGDSTQKQIQTDPETIASETAVYSPSPTSELSPLAVQPDILLDTFFSRCHTKVYHILDETSTRQRINLDNIPSYLLFAIYAVSSRYAAHPNGYHAAVRLSEEYALRSRTLLDIDDPSIDCLQALLLLAVAFTAAGRGKKAYMMLASGVGMAMALELHRELDLKLRVTPVEREMRRRLFWTCFLMDRFTACGSRRPSLIGDKSILLRLPSWKPSPQSLPVEGEFFQNGSNLQYHSGSGKKCQGSSGMLIDIVRILGITHRYLAAGGVKGDSHFPWHSLSNLSKIRQELDIWASGTQEVFSSVDMLFGQPDSTVLVLSKLIYHLIHCLIYRPFLPIDLSELAGTGQHQSWQIEATNLCFLHANAIAELVELGKQSTSIEWPAFVGYCICTAGTVHVHGAHYKGGREGEVFSTSADFLSREMQQLSELRYAWSSVQHQRDTLQTIYGCHSDLVKSLASNPMRYSAVFHLEDFFDRYIDLGQFFDGAHISFADIVNEAGQESYAGHGLYTQRTTNNLGKGNMKDLGTSAAKRKHSSAVSRKRHLDLKVAHRNSQGHGDNNLLSPSGTVNENLPHQSDHHLNAHRRQQRQQQIHNQAHIPQPHHSDTFSTHQNQPGDHGVPHPNDISTPISHRPYSPSYTYTTPQQQQQQHHDPYDPMFGMPQHALGWVTTAATPTNHSNGMGLTPAHNGNAHSNGIGEGRTPSARSIGDRSIGDSVGTEGEKDPFLSLLEQLAENEDSRGGPSELDFFLSGAHG